MAAPHPRGSPSRPHAKTQPSQARVQGPLARAPLQRSRRTSWASTSSDSHGLEESEQAARLLHGRSRGRPQRRRLPRCRVRPAPLHRPRALRTNSLGGGLQLRPWHSRWPTSCLEPPIHVGLARRISSFGYGLPAAENAERVLREGTEAKDLVDALLVADVEGR